jgi:hypothetical protein
MGVIKKLFELFYYPLPNPPPERGRETSSHIRVKSRYKVGLSCFSRNPTQTVLVFVKFCYLSPSPFQGEGWDGGDQKTFELFYYPLPNPPPLKGGGKQVPTSG